MMPTEVWKETLRAGLTHRLALVLSLAHVHADYRQFFPGVVVAQGIFDWRQPGFPHIFEGCFYPAAALLRRHQVSQVYLAAFLHEPLQMASDCRLADASCFGHSIQR